MLTLRISNVFSSVSSTALSTFVMIGLLALAASPLAGDPLPGQVLKFQQLPMDATPVAGALYWGHDELSTARESSVDPTGTTYVGEFMADDFADPFDTPVVHIRWWGSYLNLPAGSSGVRRFLIAWETDVPDPGDPHDPSDGFSHPGNLIQAEVVDRGPLSPGSGTFTETLISPGGPPLNEALYQYNAELSVPFEQDPNTVYWLKIVALTDASDPALAWGWHNRDYTITDPVASVAPAVVPGEHDSRPFVDPTFPSPVWHFQDDAILGTVQAVVDPSGGLVSMTQAMMQPQQYINDVDGPGPNAAGIGGIGQFSKDLAFELYTVIPEPGSVAILAAGLLLVSPRRGVRRGRSMD